MPAMHNYECGSCGCYFEAFFELMADATETHPCPSCGDVSKRQMCSPSFTIANGTSNDGRSSPLKDKKFAMEFCEYQIAKTKNRLDRGGEHYSKFNYNPEKDNSDKKPRRLNNDELKEKIKVAQDQTIDTHKRAGLEHKLGKKIT